jgi:hypothetical protein
MDNSCLEPGWLSPTAKFYPIGDRDHENYAIKFLGHTSEELENMDWIQTRIIDAFEKPIDLFHLTRFEQSVVHVTFAQYEWIKKHPVDVGVVEYRPRLSGFEEMDNSGD